MAKKNKMDFLVRVRTSAGMLLIMTLRPKSKVRNSRCEKYGYVLMVSRDVDT